MKKILIGLFCLISMNCFSAQYYTQNVHHLNKTFEEIKKLNLKIIEVRPLVDNIVLIIYE